MALSKGYIALVCLCVTLILAAVITSILYGTVDRWKVVRVTNPLATRGLRLSLKPRVLHLVLWSQGGHYDAMKKITQPYYQRFAPHVRTVYYAFDTQVRTPTLVDANTLLLPGTESYHPGILHKTLLAILHMWQPEYTFLFRSNVSTVVNWPILLELLAQHAGDLQLGGGNIIKSVRLHQFGKTFVQGTAIIMAAPVVNWLLHNLDSVNQKFMDDVALTQLCKKCPLVQELHDFGKQYKLTCENYVPTHDALRQYAFFRNKTRGARHVDIAIMRTLIAQLLEAAPLP